MQKKSIEKNINLILSIFILIQPILDLATGIIIHKFNYNLTIGIVFRMAFLAFIMYIACFLYKQKKLFIYYSIILIYFVLYLIGICLFKGNDNLFREVQGFIRVFYFPILISSLHTIKDKIRISNMTLFTSLLVYLVAIFIPLLFNVGYKTYQITKVGTLGFYNSANEISGIISILTPIVFIIFNNKKKFLLKFLFFIIYSVVILMVGTKTPLLSLIITIFVTFIYVLLGSVKKKQYKLLGSLLTGFIIVSALFIIIVPKTNFYKNIKTHLNYLKVKDVTDVFQDSRLFDHFIFSQRLTFLSKRNKTFTKSNIYQKFFGYGYVNLKDKNIKLIEIDYFDVFYSHGILGFIIFFSIYGYILYESIKIKSKNNYNTVMKKLCLFLIIVLSLFTGHIITAPSVSILVVVLILDLIRQGKKRLLFTANNLDVGGIESALTNLINNINYDKYEVSLVLEKKEGVFLSEINDNVIVKELAVNDNKNIIIRKSINCIRKIIFTIFNYQTFDFSCCYATYSYSGNKLSKIASANNSIYIHSDYKYLYDEKEFRNFFDSRNIFEFKTIIFVSNESKNNFLAIYPQLKNKTIVFNNFVDISKIKKLSEEKIPETKPKNKKLLVFVGRLDDSSKKVSRIINLASHIENIEVWIIGDGPDKLKYQEEVDTKKLNNKVIFKGKKENPYPYINLADYIILTSDYEGFPVVYLESIVLNKDIITTINVSDEYMKIDSYASIISKNKDQEIEEVKDIISKGSKHFNMDLEKIQKMRMKKLEGLFDEVV